MKVFLAILPGITAFLGWMAALGTQWLTGRWTRRAARRAAWDDWQRDTILEAESLLQQYWSKVLMHGEDAGEEEGREIVSLYSRGTLKATLIDDDHVRLTAGTAFETVLKFTQKCSYTHEARGAVRDHLLPCYKVMSEAARNLGRPE